ncbi:MAG TPA: TetR/AcrR family transcriptional regulator [Symbiobacteriaceae bacterium]
MPTQTFLNLPEPKRRRFIEVAIEEFANHHYRSASISRLVAKAGIAKGSFYQYFHNKKELYLYLIELALREKLDFLSRYQQQASHKGFFAALHSLLQANAAFDLALPRLSRLISRALSGDLPYKHEIIRRVKEMVLQRAQNLVKEAVARGDLRPDLDQDLAAFVITVLANEFGGYLAQRLQLEGHDVPPGQNPPELTQEKGQRLFHQLIDLLQYGMGARAVAQG